MSRPFSILIPTWNNLDHLQLLIRSLRENSATEHQILIHVNEGSDGTAEWLEDQDHAFIHTEENIGICQAMNGLAKLAEHDLLVYFNDDMYACPGWDVALSAAIDQTDGESFYYSATMIEPRESGNKCVVVFDAGSDVSNFKESELTSTLSGLNRPDWNGATWPPSVMHRKLWDRIGGFSEEFSPGLYSDPDISMKLWKAGIRDFRGVGTSLVYHFMQKSTGRVKLNDGKKTFLDKWGVSASHFTKQILKQGSDYSGFLPDQEIKPSLKDRVKRLF